MKSPHKRKGLSKKTRFEVFARDNFTCRYCGRQSDEAKLVVDHITPVCQGGANSLDNLITSCEACNQGKSGKTIAQSVPNETDRLRILQEYQEQNQIHRAAIAAAQAEKELRQILVNKFCECSGRDEVDRKTINTLCYYMKEFGPALVLQWIEIASLRVCGGSDKDIGRYVSGIRRKYLLEEPEICQ